ncbi:hypothetical protein PINS_up012463 [Pythium insidiosum]|nr:hypothetical protein PINS_up012463 [Pythium insidiosum]
MRLNLQRRGESGAGPSSPRRGGASDDKFASAFGRSGGASSGGLRRFADERPSGDRWGSGRDRFDDRDRGFGSRDRFDDRRGFSSSSRFDRGYDDRRDDAPPSNAFSALRVNEDAPASRDDEPNEELDKKARAQKLREERKKKAEEEKKAAEEAKRKAAEEKKAKEEAEAAKADGDRAIMKEVLSSGKLGEELAAVAKKAFAASGRPSGGIVVEAVTKQAEDVAKGQRQLDRAQQVRRAAQGGAGRRAGRGPGQGDLRAAGVPERPRLPEGRAREVLHGAVHARHYRGEGVL